MLFQDLIPQIEKITPEAVSKYGIDSEIAEGIKLQQMLDSNPSNRPTLDQICDHPTLKKIRKSVFQVPMATRNRPATPGRNEPPKRPPTEEPPRSDTKKRRTETPPDVGPIKKSLVSEFDESMKY